MMRSFRGLSTCVTTWLAITTVACTGKDNRADPQREKQFRAALLTPGPISDKSWNGGAYDGLMRIRDSMNAEVSHIQTRTPAEFDENFRHYGARGFNVVFGHGFEFQDAAERAARQFPNTVFITTSGTRTGPNLAGADFAFEEASYLAGMAAGATTKSGVIGIIGGTELPPVKRSFAAFEQGVRAINPTVQFLISYIGNWDDVSAGKEQAIAQISRNADVIFQNADAAGLGVFQAVRERPGVRIVGSNADQNGIAPEHTLGSVAIDLPRALLLMAREVQQGNFTGRVFPLGLKAGVVRYIPNPRLAGALPKSLSARIDSTEQQMIEGTFAGKLLPDSVKPVSYTP